jgi:signal peptidase I
VPKQENEEVATAKNFGEKAVSEKPHETTVEFFASLAELLVIVLFIMTFILQNFEIPSSSMEDTLLIGDHVFVDRERLAPPTHWLGPLLPYRDIHHGDVAVFLSPEQQGLFLVKRIIGLPGDRIHLRDGVVYRNDERLNEPYVRHKRGNYDPYRDNFPAVLPSTSNVSNEKWAVEMPSHIESNDILVPADSYFAMGDNRDVSYDSRYWGFIPRKNLIGQPTFIYWSFITPAHQYLKHGAGDRLRFIAHIVIHFFDQTRWSRTLRIVK